MVTTIRLGYPLGETTRELLRLFEGRELGVVPVFYTLGVNEQQTKARLVGGVSLEHEVNASGGKALQAYYQRLMEYEAQARHRPPPVAQKPQCHANSYLCCLENRKPTRIPRSAPACQPTITSRPDTPAAPLASRCCSKWKAPRATRTLPC